ncbi:hypothetical protein V5T82_08215 [Magnetovibrio sp. PR-2]|uniref:hypothetical protein n=1 Tax=Magnetovibrio sp. PR-2 TaxID=3120356 RepID=UPI002FCE5D5B
MTDLSITKDEINSFVGNSEAKPDDVYKLSHAGTKNSGLSVGQMQTDFSEQSRDTQKAFVEAVGLKGNDAAKLATELGRKGNSSFVESELAAKVNENLKSQNGIAFVDNLDNRQVGILVDGVANVVQQAQSNPRYKHDPGFRSLIDSKAFQVMVASNVNQFGPAGKLGKYLGGEKVEIGKKTHELKAEEPLNLATLMSYESNYQQVTRSPQDAKLMRERRQGELRDLSKAGMITSFDYQKALFAADVFYRSTQEVKSNTALAGLRSEIAKNGFTPLTVIASTRYMQELARPNGTPESARQKAFDGYADARNYSGPSQENTAVDNPMSKAELEAAIVEARKGVATQVIDGLTGEVLYEDKPNLLSLETPTNFKGMDSVTISNIPDGAFLSAGSTNFSSPSDAALLDGLTSYYGGDRAKAETAMWASAPERTSMPNAARATKAAVSGLQSVRTNDNRAVKTDADAASLAGLMMDKDTTREMMKSGAYRNEHHPQYGFTQAAVKSFFGNTYRDNSPAAPTRTTALEEPSRNATVRGMQAQKASAPTSNYASVQKSIDQEIEREERAANKQRAAMAKQEAKEQAKRTEQAMREEEGVGAVTTAKASLTQQSVLGTPDEPLGQSQAAKNAFLDAPKQSFRNDDAPITNTPITLGAAAVTQQQVSKNAQRKAPSKPSTSNRGPDDWQNDGIGTTHDYSGSWSTDNSKGYTGTDKTAKGSVITAAGNLKQRSRGKANTNDGSAGPNSGKVICTELFRQGLLPYEIYAADQRFGLHLAQCDPYVMIGYHAWAKPLACAMKKSVLLTRFVHHSFAMAWAQEMFAREVKTAKGTLRGKFLITLGVPLCRRIGMTLSKRKKPGANLRAF